MIWTVINSNSRFFVCLFWFWHFNCFFIILVCFAFGLCEAAGLRKLLHSLLDGREETWHAKMMGVDLFASLAMGIWFDRFWRHLEVVMFVVSMLSRLIWYACVIVVWQSKHSRDGFSSKTSYVCQLIYIAKMHFIFYLCIGDLVFWCVCVGCVCVLFNFGLFVYGDSVWFRKRFDVESSRGRDFLLILHHNLYRSYYRKFYRNVWS